MKRKKRGRKKKDKVMTPSEQRLAVEKIFEEPENAEDLPPISDPKIDPRQGNVKRKVYNVPLKRFLEVRPTQKITDRQLYDLGKKVYGDMRVMFRKGEFVPIQRVQVNLTMTMKEMYL